MLLKIFLSVRVQTDGHWNNPQLTKSMPFDTSFICLVTSFENKGIYPTDMMLPHRTANRLPSGIRPLNDEKWPPHTIIQKAARTAERHILTFIIVAFLLKVVTVVPVALVYKRSVIIIAAFRFRVRIVYFIYSSKKEILIKKETLCVTMLSHGPVTSNARYAIPCTAVLSFSTQ